MVDETLTSILFRYNPNRSRTALNSIKASLRLKGSAMRPKEISLSIFGVIVHRNLKIVADC